MIINPLGEIIAYGEDGTDDIIVGDIRKDFIIEVQNSFKFKQDRREELYYQLNNKINS